VAGSVIALDATEKGFMRVFIGCVKRWCAGILFGFMNGSF